MVRRVMSVALDLRESHLSIIETDRLNGHDVSAGVDTPESDENAVDRDPSRLPVNNLDAYKNWCQRVKEDWDPVNQ